MGALGSCVWGRGAAGLGGPFPTSGRPRPCRPHCRLLHSCWLLWERVGICTCWKSPGELTAPYCFPPALTRTRPPTPLVAEAGAVALQPALLRGPVRGRDRVPSSVRSHDPNLVRFHPHAPKAPRGVSAQWVVALSTLFSGQEPGRHSCLVTFITAPKPSAAGSLSAPTTCVTLPSCPPPVLLAPC